MRMCSQESGGCSLGGSAAAHLQRRSSVHAPVLGLEGGSPLHAALGAGGASVSSPGSSCSYEVRGVCARVRRAGEGGA